MGLPLPVRHVHFIAATVAVTLLFAHYQCSCRSVLSTLRTITSVTSLPKLVSSPSLNGSGARQLYLHPLPELLGVCLSRKALLNIDTYLAHRAANPNSSKMCALLGKESCSLLSRCSAQTLSITFRHPFGTIFGSAPRNSNDCVQTPSFPSYSFRLPPDDSCEPGTALRHSS